VFSALVIEASNQVPDPNMNTRLRLLMQVTALLATVALLSGCASLTNLTAPRVSLAGIESLPGEGLELRLMLKLRVQNPGDADLRYDGIWAEVELRGQPLASGGAPVTGVVPRFGEAACFATRARATVWG
jgi:LEA14-like dessication related protein